MRISDWSSDVCSSDLDMTVATGGPRRMNIHGPSPPVGWGEGNGGFNHAYRRLAGHHLAYPAAALSGQGAAGVPGGVRRAGAGGRVGTLGRQPRNPTTGASGSACHLRPRTLPGRPSVDRKSTSLTSSH